MRRRKEQRGFALLLVFAMAAAVAVMLYLEMPRVAFEHQRNKEALLVERGEEYIRAVELFVRKVGKYPQTVEELESFQNLRFLRKRYRDPMTGEEEWRLVHVDASGQFVDSLVHKREDQKKESGPSVLSSTIVGIGENAQYVQQPGQGGAPALQRRASDRIIPGAPGSVGGTGGGSGEDGPDGPQEESRSGPPTPVIPGQPQGEGAPQRVPGMPPVPGMQPGQGQMPGMQPGQGTFPPGTQGPPGFPTQPVSSQQGGAIGQPIQQGGSGFGFGNTPGSGQARPGQGPSGGFGQGGFGQGGMGQSGVGQGGFGQGGFGQPGQSSGSFGGSGFGGQGAPNQALQAIRNILTNPRGTQQGVGMPGQQGGAALGGGLVGIASKRDQEGIRIYNEKTNYKEWEFVFDAKKAMEKAGAAGQMPGGGAGPQGMQGQPGMPGQQGRGGMSGGGLQGSFGGMSGGTPAPSRPSSGSGGSGFGFGGGFGMGSGAGTGTGTGSGSGSTGTPKPGSGGLGSGSGQQPTPRPGPGRQ